MLRARQCGCDCRDEDKTFGGALPNAICCATCEPENRPCCYIAQFGCGIPSPLDANAPWQNYPEWNLVPPRIYPPYPLEPTIAGNVYLRVMCANQEEACKYVSIDSHYYNPGPWWLNVEFKYKTQNTDECFPTWKWAGYGNDGLPVVPNPGSDLSIAFCDQCTWDKRIVITPTISVQELWILHLDDPDDPVNVTLKHSQFDIEYTIPRTSWNCIGPNTLTMTVEDGSRKDGGFIELPNRVCVVPNAEEQHNPCDDRLPCDYGTEEDRCACCDDCCDKRIGLAFTCVGGTSTGISGVATGPGRAAQGSADGQTYEFFSDVTIDGNTHNVGTVLYCSGGAWKSDLYCDEVYEQTIDIPTECCPLRGTTEWTWSCVDCSVCLTLGSGVDCEPPPPPVETDCCPDDPIPATLHLEITDSDCPDLIGETATLVYDEGATSWIGDGNNCMGTFVLECNGGQWDLNNAGVPPSTATCSPIEITWGNLAGALNPIIVAGCCLPAGNATTIEVTITA